MSSISNVNYNLSGTSSISTGSLVNSTAIWGSSVYTGYTYTTYDYKHSLEEEIMQLLESDPELLNKIIVELRRKKIDKIKNK